MNDDDLPDIGGLWVCDGCGLAVCVLPPGQPPPTPWHIYHHSEEMGLQICGDFVYRDKCPACLAGTCPNQVSEP